MADINFLKQLYLSVVASMGYLTMGLVRGWSATAKPSLEQDPTMEETEEILSWITAVPPLGAVLGAIVSAPLLHYAGRKRTMVITCPVFIIGWVYLKFSTNFTSLIAARFITGVGAGIVIPTAQIYVSECVHANVRGILSSLPSLFMTIGVLISYTMGIYLPWDQLALYSAIFPFITLLGLFSLPESPTWLNSKGNTKQAEQAMKWLDDKYRTGLKLFDTDRKLQPSKKRKLSSTDIANLSARKSSVNVESLNLDFVIIEEKKLDNAESIFDWAILRPFLLCLGLLVFQPFTGIETIIYYTVDIFKAAESTVEGHIATVLLGLVQVLATIASIFFVDKIGRKPLLAISGVLMAMSLAALGVYFFHERRNEVENLGFIPLIALIIFVIGFSIGFSSIPFVVMGEILPEKKRNILSAVVGSIHLASMFIVIKTYDIIVDTVRHEGLFGIYSGLCLLSSFFICYSVPETKKKTLKEIEDYFRRRPSADLEATTQRF